MQTIGRNQRYGIHRLLLIGGGRWSRVLLPVIRSLLGESTEIHWITRNSFQVVRNWLADQSIANVTVSESIHLSTDYQAAIVATAPWTHHQYIDRLLSEAIPTFCEKPLTLSWQQAIQFEQTARERSIPLGVNLELHFASYIEQLAKRLVDDRVLVRSLSMEWLDPWTEVRYGELKHGDLYTPMVHDMFPHCWSVLRRLLPDHNIDAMNQANYDPHGGVTIQCQTDQSSSVTMQLSRRNPHRVRKVVINDGEIQLDFSPEPGTLTIGDHKVENQWQGDRPLARSLKSFFDVVHQVELRDRWALSIGNCLDSIRWAEQIEHRVALIQEQAVKRLKADPFNIDSPSDINLLIDYFLPKLAEKGERLLAITGDQQVRCAEHIISSGCLDGVHRPAP
jgi:predicted dehydrogenase